MLKQGSDFSLRDKRLFEITEVEITSDCIYFHLDSIFQIGIGGALWYTLSVLVSILLFPALSLALKTRAPGAKTFPQVSSLLTKYYKTEFSQIKRIKFQYGPKTEPFTIDMVFYQCLVFAPDNNPIRSLEISNFL